MPNPRPKSIYRAKYNSSDYNNINKTNASSDTLTHSMIEISSQSKLLKNITKSTDEVATTLENSIVITEEEDPYEVYHNVTIKEQKSNYTILQPTTITYQK